MDSARRGSSPSRGQCMCTNMLRSILGFLFFWNVQYDGIFKIGIRKFIRIVLWIPYKVLHFGIICILNVCIKCQAILMSSLGGNLKFYVITLSVGFIWDHHSRWWRKNSNVILLHNIDYLKIDDKKFKKWVVQRIFFYL